MFSFYLICLCGCVIWINMEATVYLGDRLGVDEERRQEARWPQNLTAFTYSWGVGK
jgi:hypothetical protein